MRNGTNEDVDLTGGVAIGGAKRVGEPNRDCGPQSGSHVVKADGIRA